MRLKIHLGTLTIRNWHIVLLTRLSASPDIEVSAEISPSTKHQPSPNSLGLELLFQLETLIHRIPAGGLASAAPRSALDPYLRCSGPYDLVLDLSGDLDPHPEMRVWQLAFNGSTGENALLSLLISGQAPIAEILELQSVVVLGRLGTEFNGILLASLQDAFARIITLIMAAFAGAAANKLPRLSADELPESPPKAISLSVLTAKGMAELSAWIVRTIYRLCFNTPHWRVGWRRFSGPDTIDLGCHPTSGWQDLPDDGARFYADPFPLYHKDRVTLFVEDFEHKTAKGIISAISFGPQGPIGRPEPVLELPYHLSYPFIFIEEDQAWMIPESTASATIDLFRATKYPGGWVKEATLVSSVVASDATLVFHDGLWWLFATVRDGGGAFSDALHIWSAADFRGPWLPHARNPVLIDIASARPAGKFVNKNGQLFRPVQDCRRGYGHALGIARVLTLDQDRFEQTVDSILRTGPAWLGRRIHTLNSAGGFEFIDGSGRSGLSFGRN
jgi:hypothetical protein